MSVCMSDLARRMIALLAISPQGRIAPLRARPASGPAGRSRLLIHREHLAGHTLEAKAGDPGRPIRAPGGSDRLLKTDGDLDGIWTHTIAPGRAVNHVPVVARIRRHHGKAAGHGLFHHLRRSLLG